MLLVINIDLERDQDKKVDYKFDLDKIFFQLMNLNK